MSSRPPPAPRRGRDPVPLYIIPQNGGEHESPDAESRSGRARDHGRRPAGSAPGDRRAVIINGVQLNDAELAWTFYGLDW
jgi:hypothetical protein